METLNVLISWVFVVFEDVDVHVTLFRVSIM